MNYRSHTGPHNPRPRCAVISAFLALVLAVLSSVAAAAPTFVSQSTAVTGNNNVQELTIPTPAGTALGDLLLATIATDNNETLNTPTGWTLVNQGSNGATVAVFYRIATGAEPANYTFTWGSNEEAAGATTGWRQPTTQR